ncbi:hypothetical protein Tco_0833836, partial [Tanacetum coccineum]
NMEIELDIENMTMSEYLEYEAAKERRLWDDVRSRRSSTNYNEADVDSFHWNKRMNQLSNHSYGFTPKFFAQPPPTPNTSKKDSDFDKILDDLFRTRAENMKRMGHDIVQDSIWEQNDDSEEDQEEDDEIVQPLIPEPINTTPLDDHYVAPATKSILDELFDELLEEIRDEILNVTMVDDEADFNPTKDLEELERLLAKEP